MTNRLLKIFSFLLVLSLYAQQAHSQALPSREDSVMQAEMYYELGQEIASMTYVVTQARDMFELAANYDAKNIWANYMAGKTYLETLNKERAVKFFKRVYEQDPNFRFDLLYSIGKAYQFGLQFDDALKFYNEYKAKLTSDVNYRGKDKVSLSEVERRIQECENGLDYVKNPRHYAIVNVSAQVNSLWPDYAPVVNADETILIFTTRRQEGNLNENVDSDNFYFEDIFISEKNANGEWGPARNIGEPINDSYHNSNLSLSADGNTLFLYRDDNGGDIFYSEREGDNWSVPLPLSKYINSSFAEKSVSVSPDGNLLFFSSDRPGGKGGLDIYVSVKDAAGKWGRSENLGAMINTEYDEESPYIHYDGKTLYFSSRGRNGMGGYDIYKAEYDSTAGEWMEPENIGYPINTPDNDVFFVPTKDGKRGYYASVRDDGQGYTDVYMVNFLEEETPEPVLAKVEEPKKEEPKKEAPVQPKEAPKEEVVAKKEASLQPITLVVRVRDNTTEASLAANVNLRRMADNQLAGKETVQEGIYQFTITPKEETTMMLSIERDGYMFKNFRLKLPAATADAQTITRTVELDPLRVGLSSVLRNIYYDFDRATFRKESYDELNKLERLLSENPDIEVEISGHTDAVGSAVYNKQLSKRRAEAVINYLTQKGISKARLRAQGYGEERPLASNDDESEGRSLNRRVEFKVLRKGPSTNP